MEKNMKTFCAVKAASIPGSGEEESEPVVFHVLCDEDRKPSPGIFITGISGDLKDSGDRCPFVVHPDGRGDYGAACDGEPDRYFNTNFRSKRIETGGLFTVWYFDRDRGNAECEATYRITDVTPLAGAAWS
ncbi:hypothetical protein [Bradyrhizobium sp. AZCC 2289]|uniref:hypothetical protein n=1 Tax=Bradyrhizobium sp. AZCC 2289 TaxID=3117026 RepID=UPI002FF3B597